MINISSSLTLVVKIGIPTIWIVFFGTSTLVTYFTEVPFLGPFSIWPFRIGLTLFLLTGIGLLYWSVMRLKRIDVKAPFFFASNYFKTYRYPFHQIERIRHRDYGLFKVIDVYLKEKGKFGQRITFLASRSRFDAFLERYPGWGDGEEAARIRLATYQPDTETQ